MSGAPIEVRAPVPPAPQPEQPAAKPPVASARLVGTLAVAGALAGLLIVLVHQWTEPRIQAHRARAIAAAVGEVLHGPARTETLFLLDGTLTASPPATVDTTKLDRIWAGYDADDRRIGFAMVAGEPGFQDVIQLMFGYDPDTNTVLGMRVLDSKETPGLGDKIEKDSTFVTAFHGAAMPMIPTKPGAGTGDPREVDTITGATISARAVIVIINNRVHQLKPLLSSGGSP
jgi:Na+-translocating ferredoxin:NAD+ oxidoreductase subunit G